jgi:hypothetical protein
MTFEGVVFYFASATRDQRVIRRLIITSVTGVTAD